MAYQPIEDYGIIGNMHTVALVGMNGSIDWFCSPNFDSPSIFAAILDDKKGGHFKIAPTYKHGDLTTKQMYWPETNVLVTRFLSSEGVGEVIDFMPVGDHHDFHRRSELIRRVNVVRGEMNFRMECFPAFNFARNDHEISLNVLGAAMISEGIHIQLTTSQPLEQVGRGLVSEFTLHEGQTTTFALDDVANNRGPVLPLDEDESEHLFAGTVEYWRNWLSQCTYRGRWREMVHRSALVLKLLTYDPTGAIVAAPTCSLPEDVGGERNWDYRYTWIRDAAFTLYALLRIGFTEEATKFMKFIEARASELNPDGSLQVMYGIDGRHELTEESLWHLEGYKGSSPVRIGNGAYDQLQLDIYGELMDSVYIYNRHAEPISFDFWLHLRRLTDWVVENWKNEDEGIWEVRGGRKHFVYSKLMCWVAIDRAIRLADGRSFPADRPRWEAARDAIYEEIMTHGWNEEIQAFVQSYDSDCLDASCLLMPLVFFVAPSDPRILKTLEAINRSPEKGGLVSNSLVYRYNLEESPDGLNGHEGAFNICTFWLVEAMSRAGRYDPQVLDQARLIFEKMLSYANHLGLYAEETGHSGEGLGNFPQAFTHLALISAACNLDRDIDTAGKVDW
ncbi:MAG: glycoside hydrolase family 15 protein [Chloroflexota bacterium]|nr:glycoside hydrolase family 15 protein [Chloroflexota bacterium]